MITATLYKVIDTALRIGDSVFEGEVVVVLSSEYDLLEQECARLSGDLDKTELRALKFIHQCNAHAELYQELKAERDELRAQVEAMRADAERYRWMRASFVRNHNHSFTWYLSMFEPLTAEGLDSNVDSARKAKP